MQANPVNVIEYFNGEKQNLIPLFQRPYTWKEKHWGTLWDDILVHYELGDNSTHFMGAIVSMPAHSVPVGVSKFLIIDGQQRLTTISILLCVLRDSLNESTAARIQEVYLTNRFREQDDTLKLVPTQMDRPAFIQLALNRTIPEDDSLIAKAYNFFKKKLDGQTTDGDTIDKEKILLIIEKSLQVVMINLGDIDDPYLIFESLNFKGAPLTQADLVRNYLLMKFRHSVMAGGEQERIYRMYWSPLEVALDSNLTEFLRHYVMKSGQNILKSNIYTGIKSILQKVDTPEAAEHEMKQMDYFGKIYAKFLDSSLESDLALRKRLVNIEDLTVTTSYPLLLRLFDARNQSQLSTDELEKCLGLVESFIIRRAVCGAPTNAHNKLFLQWAKSFPASNHFQWLLNAMSSSTVSTRFPGETEFSAAFKTQPQYGRAATRFILRCLEESFCHKESVDCSVAAITIEHILPQSITKEWEAELGATAHDVHARLKDTFGNLTLTGYNSELSNLPFSAKKEKLHDSHLELNRQICAVKKWDEKAILDRADNLLRVAKTIWPRYEDRA